MEYGFEYDWALEYVQLVLDESLNDTLNSSCRRFSWNYIACEIITIDLDSVKGCFIIVPKEKHQLSVELSV